MQRLSPALIAVLALAGCVAPQRQAPTPVAPAASLDLAAVDVDRDCKPNAFTDWILSELGAGDGSADRAGWAGHAIEHRLHVWEGVKWRGLTLNGIGSLQGIESGPSVFSLYFREAPAVVLSRLNAQGYDLPAAGEDRPIEGALSIGVHKDGDGAALTCWFD